MIKLTLEIGEKVLVTLHPSNFVGVTSEVQNVTWTVLNGNSTVTPSADGMSAVIVAAPQQETSIILVGANTNVSASVNTGSVNTGSVNTGSVNTGSFNSASLTGNFDTDWDYSVHSKKANTKHDKRVSTSVPTAKWWDSTSNWSQHDYSAYTSNSLLANSTFSLDKMENADGIIYNHIQVNVVQKRVDKTHGQSTNLGLTAGSPEQS
jgi:hypothetical protein